MANLENWQWAYFGNAYPALQAIKAKYDPGNFFNYQQSIEPASNPVGANLQRRK